MKYLTDLLSKFSPLNEEQPEEAPIAPPAPQQPQAAPAPIPQQGGVEEVDLPGMLAPLMQQRPADRPSPQIKMDDLMPSGEAQALQQDALAKKLDQLKADYETAQEDARSRQMKAEMIAALGNNINQIVAGANSATSGIGITPAQGNKIAVPDLVGRADSRFNKDYDNLLKQYKGLKDGQLTSKDIIQARTAQAYIDSATRRANDNVANTDRNAGMRGTSIIANHQKGNELSDKQVESIVGFNKTNNLLNDIEQKIADGKLDKYLGPYASKAQNAKEYIPGSDGMDPEFAKFQSDITDSLSQYIKNLSGLTVSDKERETLLTSVPKVGDKPQTFRAKLEATRKRLAEYERIEKEALKKYQGKNAQGYKQPPTSSATVRIQGPSGQVATVPASSAEKYLSRPGYKKLD